MLQLRKPTRRSDHMRMHTCIHLHRKLYTCFEPCTVLRWYVMSGIWPWLAALNRLTVLPAFLLQNVWHASRGTFAPSAFVGLQSNNRDGIYFCLFWCFALSINWVSNASLSVVLLVYWQGN